MRKAAVSCLSLAGLWTVLLLIGAATVPVYSGSSTTVTSGGSESTTTTSATALQVNGMWVLVLLAVPAFAVLVAAGLLFIEPRHRWAGWAAWGPVGLVGLLTLLGMLTIGVFLLPVAALLGVAVLTVTLDRSRSSEPAPPGLPPSTPLR
jgi:hypothetical protein